MSKALALGLIAILLVVAAAAVLMRFLARTPRAGLPKGIVRERARREAVTKERDATTVALDGVEGRVEKSTVKKVESIVEDHPDEAVSVVRRWMRE